MAYNQIETGKRLKKLRTERKLSLEQVAERIGVQQYQTVSKWESGDNTPSIDKLVKLSELYGCEIGYLIGEFDCKYRSNADIKAVTGLSEKAISRISSEVKGKGMYLTSAATITERKALNSILEFSDGVALRLIARYLYPDELSYTEEIETNDLKEAVLCMEEIKHVFTVLREKIRGGQKNG